MWKVLSRERLICDGVANEEEKRKRALTPRETSAGTLEGGVEETFSITVVLLVFLAITSNLVFRADYLRS
jgi:hypothetical protein